MALHDTLTGLPNRTLLNKRLERTLARLEEADIAAVHLLDLDLFKNVNDTLGHHAGDELLKMVAARLQALACDTDTVVRMGGDEFAIVQTRISNPSEATRLAHRTLEAVSEPYEIEGHQVVIGSFCATPT
jgi:diguanylate cyclase (GGDEF)-like protein